MEEVIKAYVEATKRNGMSKCEAIRAVVQQFIDVPRGELVRLLVESCKLNPATVRTQYQLGRKQAAQQPAPSAQAAPEAADAKPAPVRKAAKRK
jgi:hypothetical protein